MAAFQPLSAASGRLLHGASTLVTVGFPASFPPLVHPPVFSASTTALRAGSAVEAAALGFFSGIRIPAALIAGSSLSAFFNKNDNYSSRNLVLLDHMFSLVSLLLSLNVVITATAAGTTLLLDDYGAVGETTFSFLKRFMYYEFLTTRWSFFTSLLSFIGSVTTRALIEFDLLAPKRRKLAGIFLLSVGSLVTHLVSFINGSLYSSPNLVAMTMEVAKVFWDRALSHRNPLDFVSVLFLLLAISLGISSIWEQRNKIEE